MNLYLFYDEEIITFSLPSKKIGNFWMCDNSGKNIININGENNEWVISGSENVDIITKGNEERITLELKNYYVIDNHKERYVLYCDDLNTSSFKAYQVLNGSVIRVGSSTSADINIPLPYLKDVEYELSYQNDIWSIRRSAETKVYLNDSLIKEDVVNTRNGSIINTYGLIVVLAKDTIFVYSPYNLSTGTSLTEKAFTVNDELVDEEIENENMYQDSDYFLRSPRMRRVIETLVMSIDSPPPKENVQEVPIIATLAPMLTMAASAMVTLTTTIQAINSGERTLKQSLPSLAISIGMIFSMVVWPFISKKIEARNKKKREKARQDKYGEYLNKKRTEIIKEYETQEKILNENLLQTNVCYDMIVNKRRTLWGRRLDQGDFLTVRIGKGQIPFNANISYHQEDFKMEDDILKEMTENLVNQFKVLNDVPIEYSFTENKFTAINGIYPKYYSFVDNLLIQIMAYHTYSDLKIAIFTNKKNAKKWEFLKETPYVFSNDKSIRFFATTTEEMQEVSEYLKPRFNNRQQAGSGMAGDRADDFSRYQSYYLLIVDDIDAARKIGIIDDVLEEKRNLGYSLIVIEEKLSKIPSEISKFITIGESASVVINSENNDQIRFADEISNDYDYNLISRTLSNLPVYMDDSVRQLPDTITFLELFGVGQIEQLNVLNRWKEHNPIKSLRTEVGVNENLDPFVLDLHEKYHGPHGLIAGMTGSGKSEFIITYILSMAVNYSPEEVSFVLIDYKGGGLAGAFVNSETGQKLPHVVGTITNLDKTEINRALSSIQSELRRRQAKFNEVRDKLGESTIDIYKYQKLYREGVVREPIPHLIIVSDEFAELKDQQPDFMDDLISTARIGRSLGVHLILATQKPSGVVNAQIWSNSKFKVCLKVQDRSDSTEMIKNELAAELKNVGRFYLQVGYNEFFALGQAAWAGAQYYPSKEFKKMYDKNLYFINDTGSVVDSINNSQVKHVKSEGEELTNIVKYLMNIQNQTELHLRQLWLDRIPNDILLKDTIKKYNYAKEDFIINPVLGEYDDPTNQMQGLLTLPITRDGNTIIYGTNDSGKDELLSSLVYSMIDTYSTDELNLYLVDLGAETLMNFSSAPQVGNVILSGEDEKLENLAKMLNSEINKRKKLFLPFNGNYIDFIAQSKKTVPNIVVVINAIEVLNEINPDYLDKITPIVREGSKYGINFVITSINQSTVRFKISQSCKQALCLQMKNDMDYREILGKTNGIVPSASLGRGLAKIDRVVEFQIAFITNDANPSQEIKELIASLNEKGLNKAKSIPTMPEIVEIAKFDDKYIGINSVPIGLEKESLNACLFDFSKSSANLITTSEFDNFKAFIPNFIKVLERNPNYNKVIIDASNFFDDFNYNVNYINNNFDDVISQLSNIDKQLQDYLEKNNMNLRSIKEVKNNLVVIIGLEKFMSKLDDEHKTMFINIIKSQKEILKINFAFVDTVSAIKKYEYEDWYKEAVDADDGIWIGSNITQQFTLKLSIQPPIINRIDNGFGIYVKNGVPIIIKFINEIK